MKQTERIQLRSEAFPQQTKPKIQSEIHQLLTKINFDPRKHTNPIKIRQIKLSDIQELKKLQNQWFPLRYSKDFYDKIIHKQSRCLIAQTNIHLPKNKENSKETEQLQNALKKLKLSQNQEENSQQFNIIVGALVFQIQSQSNYLERSFVKKIMQYFIPNDNSLYIMTLGVIDEFRNYGVAKLLINELFNIVQRYEFIKLIFLHVVSYNQAAIKFYKKMKFQQLDYQRNYYHIGNKQYDGVAYGFFVNQGKKANQIKWFKWLTSER